MNKKIIGMCSGLLAVTFASMLFVGGNKTDWKTRYDTSLPDLNSGSWKETLHTDFTKIENMESSLPQIGRPRRTPSAMWSIGVTICWNSLKMV